MKRNVALITGITGQDGSYLAELLLDKGYEVHGLKRRSSLINTQRVDHIYDEPYNERRKFILHYSDLTDSLSISKLVGKIKPTEIYNLGAQSRVAVSFEAPEYTGNTDALGSLRILEAILAHNLVDSCRYYQASTSELYGKVQEIPQTEETPFYPRSPYAVAKLYSYWITVNYREAYGIHASNGILFNHESPRRGETFVTRKITRAAAAIKLGLSDKLYLGNLDSKRDWGHAKEYVEMMWRMLQADKPGDYVAATNTTNTVRYFVEKAFKRVNIDLIWNGSGEKEKGICKQTNRVIVEVDPRYFRPTEVDLLIGDSSKAKKELGWEAKITVEELVNEMVDHDLKECEKILALKK